MSGPIGTGGELRVLILEDSAYDAELMEHQLRRSGLTVVSHRTAGRETFQSALAEFAPDIILADYGLPGFDGLVALDLAREASPGVPVILVSGTIGEDLAVESLKRGATDYVLKNHLLRLGPAVERAMSEVRAREERRRLEEGLRRAATLEAVGRLAAGVAHDFNNVLTAVKSATALVLRDLAPGSSAHVRARLVLEASERGSGMVRQLLELAGREPGQPVELDLAETIGGCEEMLRAALGAGVRLDLVLEDGACRVRADRTQIERVLLNLAINARDAMGGQGRFLLQVSPVEERSVRLTARDTGCGMDEGVRARIFEPFFTTKGPGKGTGLGLAVVYGIVRQYGGRIDVESAPGEGTAFMLEFPRVR